jgi:hypothetical protein
MQRVQLSFDKEGVWSRVRGRLSVFLDTNFWIDMADGVSETACRVRDRLKALVATGHVFCPLSWGILEELSLQAGESLRVTANLMEELSLNAIFIMRTELFRWEFERSIRRLSGGASDGSLSGIFAPPAAFVGSAPCIQWHADSPLSPEMQDLLRSHMKEELSKIGVVELAEMIAGAGLDRTPPAYSDAAKEVKRKYKGNTERLFVDEAVNCFSMYVRPLLLSLPPQKILSWSSRFGPPDDEKAWVLKALAELPALHNHIDVMVAADCQPDRKDSNNHFMDNEIVVAPLAYATVFASRDKGIRDMLRNRTSILSRNPCQYCDSLDALELWLTRNVA